MKLRALDWYEKLQFNVMGPMYRKVGIKLFKWGVQLQGEMGSQDRLVPCLKSRPWRDSTPNVHNCRFVAPNSVVVGQVECAKDSSIWYGATIRGD